jgi:hypothetical protein
MALPGQDRFNEYEIIYEFALRKKIPPVPSLRWGFPPMKSPTALRFGINV